MSKDYLKDPTMQCLAASVQLDANLHVDAIPQHIHNFDTKAEHERNNGIWQDGGITELYEAGYDNTSGGLFPSVSLYPAIGLFPADTTIYVPGGIYYASNGSRIRIGNSSTSVNTPNVLVTGTDGVERFVAAIPGVFFDRQAISKKYIDVAIASDGLHGLGLWADYSAIYLDEFLLSDQSVTQTQTLVGSTAGYSYGLANACIVRANILTFATVLSTSGIVYCSVVSPSNATSQAVFALNTTKYVIAAISLSAVAQAGNLVAFYCGGTVLAALPAATPQILKATTPWAAWSAVQFTSGVTVDGISMMSRTNMDASATTLSLGASTASQVLPNFLIAVSAVGAVTTTTAANVLYPNVANFKMESGIVTPIGSAGIYSTNGANPYGQFNLNYSLANNPNTTKPLLGPDCDYNTFAVYLSAASTANMTLKSYKNNISIITGALAISANDGGAMINDFGGGDFDSDIQSGNVFASTNTAGVLYPPDYRKKESGASYGWFTYKLNNGQFVIVRLSETANPMFTEVAPGIVSINCLGSSNTIIDTNKNIPYENVSGYVNSFFTNYTNTASIAYVKRFNKYSNAIDQGLLTIDATAANFAVPTTALGIKLNDFSLYNGSSGVYLGNLIVAPGATAGSLYYNASNAGTYVFNPNVPVSGASSFTAGMAQLLSSTAVQTPNYYGYQLANLLSKKYTSAFNLYGTKYVFDGERIYSITLSNGDAGTINGVPQTKAFANGLRFLCASPTQAFFVSDFDNSLYTFNGGQQVTRAQGFSQKPTLQSGVYSTRDDALYLVTSSSVITVRYGIITENTLPYSPYTSFRMDNTDKGVYYVASTSARVRSYLPLSGSAVIPLDFQTAYFGMKDNQRITINRIVVYMFYAGINPTPWSLSWNWQTQDQMGTDTATIAPQCNADGYARFDWNPPHATVTAGQFGMVSADTTQKKVVLEMVAYYRPAEDANLSASNHAS